MKSTGIIRKIDKLGRIVLPTEIRKTLDLEEQDELEIFIENHRVVLQKFEPTCIFCGSSEEILSFHNRAVCRACISQLRAK